MGSVCEYMLPERSANGVELPPRRMKFCFEMTGRKAQSDNQLGRQGESRREHQIVVARDASHDMMIVIMSSVEIVQRLHEVVPNLVKKEIPT